MTQSTQNHWDDIELDDYLAENIAEHFDALQVPVAPIEIDGELPDLEFEEYIDTEEYIRVCGTEVTDTEFDTISMVESINTEAEFDADEINSRYWVML